ncbi:MAG TPA: aminotransferase class V-fold PLP-dependent enzyme [Candidatus Limnocylindrales bacterium]|nr:aminotransferase class V-fold PLP-dependent enzyme [Candidatus Limnocylindrales bacterium]
MVDPFLPEPEKVRALREGLPATGAGIYLNSAQAGPLPAETMAAMRQAQDWQLRVGRADAASLEEAEVRADEARAVVAALLGASPTEMALAHSASSALTIGAWLPDWRTGDVAVTTDQEHPRAMRPLRAAAGRLGLKLRVVEAGPAVDDARLLEGFETAFRDGARLALLSHVTWTNGRVLPVAEVVRLAREHAAWVVVDGAQAAGALVVSAPELGADLYATSGYKWLVGPVGAAACHLSERALDEGQLVLTVEGEERADRMGAGTAPPDAVATASHRFGTGGLDPVAVLGLARSVGWLEMYVGLPWALERAARLGRRFAESLAAVPGVRLLTPLDAMAGIVTVGLEDWPSAAALEELSRRIFLLASVVPTLDALRLSVSWFVTEDELDRVVEAVTELVRHTPGTLPRRPSLVVLPGDGDR